MTITWLELAAVVSVLSNSDHAASFINDGARAALGAAAVDVTILTDETSNNNNYFLGTQQLITAARDTARLNFKVSDNTHTRNSAPYSVITQSTTGYSDSLDLQLYESLYNSGTHSVLYNWPMVFPLSGTTPPPVILTNIIAPPITNPNNGTSSGTEFAMSANYKGIDTSFSSNVAAAFAGFLASLVSQHPTLNPWDIKASFRQTASKWSTGWNHDYGNIDFDAANALDASSLYLQPPRLVAFMSDVNQISLIDYPYRQTRRDHEEAYVFPTGHHWPIKNEYTNADLLDASGILIFRSNTSDVIPTGTVSFSVAPGSYDLIAFTVSADTPPRYSRVELFSITPVTPLVVVPAICL